MNPARSLGPAIESGAWSTQWLYIIAPMAGAVLGAMIYTLIRCDESDASSDDAAGCC
jgi:glycerol uptake facilitator-like aquaporin